MNANHPITIRKLANGFVVEPVLFSTAVSVSDQDTHVFETMENLQAFIRDHFNTPKPE